MLCLSLDIFRYYGGRSCPQERLIPRDKEGNIKVIFHSHQGKATNNMAKLMVMEQCLEILIKYKLHNTIIEADSELIINSVKRLGTGTPPEKVSRHWTLLQVYHRIQLHLRILRTLSFVHLRRDANRIANWLANEGVRCTRDNKCFLWGSAPVGQLHEGCHTLTLIDKEQYQHR